MKCIVSGSLGFMGSHLVDYLVELGYEVRGIDNLSTGFGSNTNPKAPTYKVDLVTEPKLVAGIIEGFKPDIVYHLAAWAHEGLSQFCPIKITENNYNATLNILIPSIKAKVKRFVFTSSMSVYGDQTPPFSEDMDRKPVDIYGVAKASSERAIEILSEVHGFDYTIIRPHNVYGPRQSLSDPYRNVVGIFIRRAIEGKELIIYGDGEQTRAFSYIDDITPCLGRAGWGKKASKKIINLGHIEEFSINQLAQLISPNVKYLPDRPLEVKHAYCTNDKALELLGYETKTTLVHGVDKMIEWAKELKETTGIAQPKYLDDLELISKNTPKTWTEKTL